MKEKPSRWIIASNRLPFSLDDKTGNLVPSPGGLVTAITGIKADNKTLWVGVGPDGMKGEVSDKSGLDKDKDYHAIDLDKDTYKAYYNGMCNNVLWPILHYESTEVEFRDTYWQAYAEVNKLFAKEILSIAEDDDLVWVHDFHLFLLPKILKRKRKSLKVGFFLHTPFPSSEIFRQLPVRKEILDSVLSADLVGFHDYSYLRHFCTSIDSIFGLESSGLSVSYKEHTAQLGVFPVSIDTQRFSEAARSPEVRTVRKGLQRTQGVDQLILGVDRLDYSKGIKLKLKAFRKMLKQHPEMRGRVSLLQVAVPTRMDVPGYVQLRAEVEQLVGEINGTFGEPNYVPVQYMFKTVSFEELLSLYQLADVLLITSKRDGMNLVALEYIATQSPKNPGVLVLSEFTGAISTLSHAIPTNPWDVSVTSENIYKALTMNLAERTHRHKAMLTFLESYTATDWAESFMSALGKADTLQGESSAISLGSNGHASLSLKTFGKEFNNGQRMTIFMDYDGTLASIEKRPELAELENNRKSLLKKVLKNKNIDVIIVSGRERKFLAKQFEGINVSLAAEHGSRFLEKGSERWKTLVHPSKKRWFETVLHIMKDYAVRVPGSFIEKKRYCVAWHYREAPPKFGSYQARKLKQDLEASLVNLPASVILGKKVVEARAIEANKGVFLNWYLESFNVDKDDFLLAFGDDETDEDMFRTLHEVGGTAVKVGSGSTVADYRIDNSEDVIKFLEELTK